MPAFFQKSTNLFGKMKNSAIDSLDIFGQLPSFRVMEKNKYNSMVGLLTTLMIGGITIAYLATEIISMLTKSEPAVVSTEIQVFDTSTYSLLNDNFTIAVSVTNVAGNSIIGQGKYYNITISHCSRTRIVGDNGAVNVTIKCELLPTETCNISHFTTDIQYEYFKKMRFGAMQCINREYLKTNPPELQGQLNAMVYQYVEIHFKTCVNTTEIQGCAPQEEIDDKLLSGHYVVYLSDYLMQLSNPHTPYQQIINSDFSGFSISTSKMIQSYFQIVETTSDDGLLFQSLNTVENLKLKERRETTELYNQQYIVDHFIALDYRQTKYTRTYIKVQAILSKIGGIWQIFIIIVATMVRPFINNQMNIDIANKIYRFGSMNRSQNLPTRIESQQVETKGDKINDNSRILTISEGEMEGPLPNDFRSTLFIMFGCHKKKRRLFDNAKTQIMQNLDMVRIIQKLQELELLKQILLTKEQTYLFSILPKPLISLKEEIPQQEQVTNHLTFVSHINQVSRIRQPLVQHVESYFRITNNRQKSMVDERLLSLFDKHTLDLFEKSVGQFNHISKSPCHMESKDEDINEPIPLLPK